MIKLTNLPTYLPILKAKFIFIGKLEDERKTFSYSDTERRLINDLLHNYNKYAHPKSYGNRTLNFTVVFGIEIVQVVDVVRQSFSR